MNEKQEELLKEYMNIKADVMLGINIHTHHLTVRNHINHLNKMIEEFTQDNNDECASSFSVICYYYYKLRDDINLQLP